VLASVVLVVEVVGILSRLADSTGELGPSMLGDIDPIAYVLVAVSSLALIWRRDWPVAVLTAALMTSLVWDLIGLEGGLSLAIVISLYGVGRSIAADFTSALVVLAAMTIVVIDDLIEGEPAPVIGLSLALVFTSWYAGRRIRARREYLALLEERTAYLERERVAEAKRAVDEERTRIARELHDVVAHRVSMITVQAGAAQTVAASNPEKAIRAMEAVENASREALDELRQVLGVLRSDEPADGLAPIHGLSEIPHLVAGMNETGVKATLTAVNTPERLPARIDLASYRIVQEALTNVLKHAGPNPTAEVRLGSEDGMLTVEVVDNGSGITTMSGAGQGLIGMRERAMLLGGTFEAGPRLAGGFRVMVRLPLDGSTT
jgi:signal transduction histidine kinase